MHIIAFNQLTHKTTPFLSFYVVCIILPFAFDLWVAWHQQQRLSSLFLKYVETILSKQPEVLKHSVAGIPLRASTRYTKLNLIACMWRVKYNNLGGSCPGGTGCGANNRSAEKHIKN